MLTAASPRPVHPHHLLLAEVALQEKRGLLFTVSKLSEIQIRLAFWIRNRDHSCVEAYLMHKALGDEVERHDYAFIYLALQHVLLYRTDPCAQI